MNKVIYKGTWSFTVHKEFVLNPNISIGAKMLYIALKSYCAPDGATAFPTRDTLATALVVHRDTILKYVAELKRLGYLTTEQCRGEGSVFGNIVYTLHEVPAATGNSGTVTSATPQRVKPATAGSSTNRYQYCSKEVPAATNAEASKKSDAAVKQAAAERIYQAYPRKENHKMAVLAIAKQLKTFSEHYLLERTKLFARAWLGVDKVELQYCPHPTTWFNQERFEDNAESWVRRTKPKDRNGCEVDTRSMAEKDMDAWAKDETPIYPVREGL